MPSTLTRAASGGALALAVFAGGLATAPAGSAAPLAPQHVTALAHAKKKTTKKDVESARSLMRSTDQKRLSAQRAVNKASAAAKTAADRETAAKKQQRATRAFPDTAWNRIQTKPMTSATGQRQNVVLWQVASYARTQVEIAHRNSAIAHGRLSIAKRAYRAAQDKANDARSRFNAVSVNYKHGR